MLQKSNSQKVIKELVMEYEDFFINKTRKSIMVPDWYCTSTRLKPGTVLCKH